MASVGVMGVSCATEAAVFFAPYAAGVLGSSASIAIATAEAPLIADDAPNAFLFFKAAATGVFGKVLLACILMSCAASASMRASVSAVSHADVIASDSYSSTSKEGERE